MFSRAASITVKSMATCAPGIAQRARLGRDLEMRVVHAELIEIDARMMRIDRGDELEIGRVEHGSTDRRSHPPAGSEDSDANHPAAPFGVATDYRRALELA